MAELMYECTHTVGTFPFPFVGACIMVKLHAVVDIFLRGLGSGDPP